MEISLPTDSDGFLSHECPSCGQQFKSQPGQGSPEPLSFCPYCGHKGHNCWLTKEQSDYVKAVATDLLINPELKKLERTLKRASKGFLKFKLDSKIPKPPPPPMETDDDFDILHFPCCGETVKASRYEKLFCVICGKEIDMTISDSKKVFLSHKGVDKEQLVIDFKKTLELLAYEPWLDEDAMPAGTSLERGLLKGMQDSCGVVFFITSSFKDQGYLETEVNYAIQEKRKKGDKFAIIALQFVDGDGTTGEIPDLLKGYVWKKPKTSLEALREIVRALPVAPVGIDWRREITGVVTMPTTKSTTAELSDEAKKILKEAAKGGGVYHMRHAREEVIQANGRQLIPDQDPRTVARWTGGLEDLKRRRYIKDRGHKGEVFEVTREGFEAADQLPDE